MTSEDIIVVENLAKMYRIGDINTGSLNQDLKRWWEKIHGREDPYERLAETNVSDKKSNTGFVWSLRDINFSVKEGEVFGIIGKNGAGKSTLLKILSKITRPTKGKIKIGGRIASLLEVGTGFHPDLSGRENIFLNGAILGMSKQEIRNRFDEIVHFSGIERYIDTPVKRYSSGMYVRLAFAVAAHLEPEILIIDEVLAVGDAEFQRKCLGKMKDVSQKQGRTVLFVSHNLTAVKQLCARALLLERGESKMVGPVGNVLELYQSDYTDSEQGIRSNLPPNAKGYFLDWKIKGQIPTHPHSCYTREKVSLEFRFESKVELSHCEFHLLVRQDDTILLHANSMHFSGSQFSMSRGVFTMKLNLDLPIRKGKYDLEVGLLSSGKWIDTWATSTKLNILDTYDTSSIENVSGILNIRTQFHLELEDVAIMLM